MSRAVQSAQDSDQLSCRLQLVLKDAKFREPSVVNGLPQPWIYSVGFQGALAANLDFLLFGTSKSETL